MPPNTTKKITTIGHTPWRSPEVLARDAVVLGACPGTSLT